MQIEIMPELKKLLRPLTDDEYALLEASIIADGVREPLSVWVNGKKTVLLDGHNRYSIAEARNLNYQTSIATGVNSLDDARRWIIKHQLGKRNLTPAEISYYRGLDYLQTKKQHGGDKKSKVHNEPLIGSTAKAVAESHKVGESTIKRDAEFASAVDKIADVIGEDAKTSILARDAKINKKDVPALAEAVAQKPDDVKDVLAGKKSVGTVVKKKKTKEPKPPRPNPEPPKGRNITQNNARGLLRDLGAAALTSLSNMSDDSAHGLIWKEIKQSNTRIVAQAIAILIEEWPADGASFFVGTVKHLKQGGNGSARTKGATPQPGKYANRK